jgi:IS6 family transposase
MMAERGLKVDHTTIYRWVQQYAPELEKRCKPHLKQTNGSWRVDETYIKVKGEWLYLYRAVDSAGNTLEFLLSEHRDTQDAKRLLARALDASQTVTPRVINVDQNPAYPKAVDELKAAGKLPQGCQLRPVKYLNNLIGNLIGQDHRFIKRLGKVGLGFCSFPTAWRTLRGYETMHMIRKGQVSAGGIQQPVWAGCLTRLVQGSHNPFTKLVRFLQQNRARHSVILLGLWNYPNGYRREVEAKIKSG